MMRRVIAILTHAADVAEALEEDVERDDLGEQGQLAGELVLEMFEFGSLAVTDPSPQAVADAVVAELQPRIGMMVGCFVAAFSRLAFHHVGGDTEISSTDMLRRMALEWELDDEDE